MDIDYSKSSVMVNYCGVHLVSQAEICGRQFIIISIKKFKTGGDKAKR